MKLVQDSVNPTKSVEFCTHVYEVHRVQVKLWRLTGVMSGENKVVSATGAITSHESTTCSSVGHEKSFIRVW